MAHTHEPPTCSGATELPHTGRVGEVRSWRTRQGGGGGDHREYRVEDSSSEGNEGGGKKIREQEKESWPQFCPIFRRGAWGGGQGSKVGAGVRVYFLPLEFFVSRAYVAAIIFSP